MGKKKLKRKITHNLLIKLFNNYLIYFLIVGYIGCQEKWNNIYTEYTLCIVTNSVN